jgi:hypothetical protein
MINTNQVTVMACGSKRSSIWLLGALIAGTRVEQVSAQTMGFDPGLLQTDSVAGPDSWCAVGYTRFYIAGLHLSMLAAVYYFVKQNITISLLKLPTSPAAKHRVSDDFPAPIADGQPVVHNNAVADQTPDHVLVAAHQRSMSGERINTAALRATHGSRAICH